MAEEKKKGHSIALSGVIGFTLVALIAGMGIGGYVGAFVIGPQIYANHQDSGNQGNSNNNQNNNNNNNNQNGNGSQGGISNNNPGPSDPTGLYTATGCQLSLTMPSQQGQISGTMTANVNCSIQVSGNNIQLSFTVMPQSVSQGLQQADMVGTSVTFNFAGTVTAGASSGSQITANAQGSAGSPGGSSGVPFDLNLSGSFGSNTLTLSVTSASDSQMLVSTPQTLTLQSS